MASLQLIARTVAACLTGHARLSLTCACLAAGCLPFGAASILAGCTNRAIDGLRAPPTASATVNKWEAVEARIGLDRAAVPVVMYDAHGTQTELIAVLDSGYSGFLSIGSDIRLPPAPRVDEAHTAMSIGGLSRGTVFLAPKVVVGGSVSYTDVLVSHRTASHAELVNSTVMLGQAWIESHGAVFVSRHHNRLATTDDARALADYIASCRDGTWRKVSWQRVGERLSVRRVPISLSGSILDAVFDTGAQGQLFLSRMPPQIDERSSDPVRLVTPGGTVAARRVAVGGRLGVPVKIGEVDFVVDAIEVPDDIGPSRGDLSIVGWALIAKQPVIFVPPADAILIWISELSE